MAGEDIGRPSQVTARSSALLLAVAGITAAWSWMRFSQPLIDTIETSSIVMLALVYHGLVYLPLALLILLLSSINRVHPLRAGDAPTKWLLIGILCGVSGVAVPTGLAWLNGGLIAPESRPSSFGADASSLLVVGFILTLFQVIVEELFFRGWLHQTLRRALGRAGSVVVAAIVYAGLSLTSGAMAFLPIANLVLMGLFLGLLADRTNGITAPIGAHFGWSAAENLILALNPNPGIGPFGAVTDLDMLGAPLWGGSEAGLAASVGTVAVLIALSWPLLVTARPWSGSSVSVTSQQDEDRSHPRHRSI